MAEERLVLDGELQEYKQQMISDMERLLAAVKEKEEWLNSIQKELSDNKWYLGEEKNRNSQLEDRVKWLEHRCQELEAQISQSSTENSRLQKELNETNWFLGEERARRQEIENQIKG